MVEGADFIIGGLGFHRFRPRILRGRWGAESGSLQAILVGFRGQLGEGVSPGQGVGCRS